MYCTKCGKKLSNEALFCPGCGCPLGNDNKKPLLTSVRIPTNIIGRFSQTTLLKSIIIVSLIIEIFFTVGIYGFYSIKIRGTINLKLFDEEMIKVGVKAVENVFGFFILITEVGLTLFILYLIIKTIKTLFNRNPYYDCASSIQIISIVLFAAHLLRILFVFTFRSGLRNYRKEIIEERFINRVEITASPYISMIIMVGIFIFMVYLKRYILNKETKS